MNTGDLDEIVLFDGVCNLCSSSVLFVIRHEKKAFTRFASLQSTTGKSLLEKYKLSDKGINSVVYISKNKAYIKSSAVLHLAKTMKGLYPALFVFIVIPAFIRNVVYDFMAKRRYNWFGKKEVCMVPDESLKGRFIDL